MIQDLKYIEKCKECDHNISYEDTDIKNGYSILYYIIKYKRYNKNYEYTNVKTIDDIGKTIYKLTHVSYPYNYNQDYSGTKICEILRRIREYKYIECPNCGKTIILSKYDTTYGYDSWYERLISSKTLLEEKYDC